MLAAGRTALAFRCMPWRDSISSDDAPEAIGPYSQAIRHGDLLFCSGQIPLDPSTGELVKQDTPGQARRCLENLEAVCQAADANLADAVRCTIYLVDMNDFTRVNDVYAEYFGDEPPARVAIGVAALPRGADVEIDAIVALGS
jgi:2-iminobutanoate/2-iminopropanoate deaminase